MSVRLINNLNTQYSENITTLKNSSAKNSTPIWGYNIIDEDDNKPQSLKEKTAKERQFTSTPSENVFYSKEKDTYFVWDNYKNKFKKLKDVESVLETGYIKTKNGSYLDNTGEIFVENYDGRLYARYTSQNDLPKRMALVNGYDTTPLSNQYGVFLNKKDNRYYQWKKDKQAFSRVAINDMNKSGYYRQGDKYYTNKCKEIPVDEYMADKLGYSKTTQKGVYYLYDDRAIRRNYVWDIEQNKFVNYLQGIDAYKDKMKNESPDGQIGSYMQGSTGDCWLLSSVDGLARHPKGKEFLNDCLKVNENGDVTVTLKGPGKSYTFTKQELLDRANNPEYIFSFGDLDMGAIEVAVNKFQNEAKKQHPNKNKNKYSYYSMSDELYGGQMRQAIHLITGKQANMISKVKDGFLRFDTNTSVIDVGDFDEAFLKKYFDNKNNITFLSLKGKSEGDPGHGVVFVKYDDNFIYVADPYESDASSSNKLSKIPKDEFYKRLVALEYTDLSTPIDKNRINQSEETYKMSPAAAKIWKKN